MRVSRKARRHKKWNEQQTDTLTATQRRYHTRKNYDISQTYCLQTHTNTMRRITRTCVIYTEFSCSHGFVFQIVLQVTFYQWNNRIMSTIQLVWLLFGYFWDLAQFYIRRCNWRGFHLMRFNKFILLKSVNCWSDFCVLFGLNCD